MSENPGPNKPRANRPDQEKTEVLRSTPPPSANRPDPASSGRSVPSPPKPAPSKSAPPKPPAPVAGSPGPAHSPPRPKRTSAQIRADIDSQREQLGGSVDALRDRVTELTDWRSQIRKHRKQIVVGAVATGFVVGGLMALRRR